MEDTRNGQKGGRQPSHTLPRRVILLATAPKRAAPELDHMLAKSIEALAIGRCER